MAHACGADRADGRAGAGGRHDRAGAPGGLRRPGRPDLGRLLARPGLRPLRTPELAAWDSLSYDPDGVVLDVFELEARDGSPLAEYDGAPSELQTVAIPGRDQREHAVPPNTGLLSVSLETGDLAATAGVLAAHGAVAVCDPVELDVPPYGPAAVQTFLGRDGELLEFYRRR
ncbi:hypothetical protein [Actinomadura sp. 7K507]|uniref:hypothetical protein n=1 Tax=Actinomadura sp. 7K507 TaxID=2530365 RepID=UPI001042E5A8|nr:hypothetical protein [Actinomadura sp. 7K507]TDC77224.1 hypothetical protein E1285_38930 [Actinomadura sp. 7K507]